MRMSDVGLRKAEFMQEILKNNISYIILYLILINLFGFLIMAIDKYKAEKHHWRIKEKTIFIVTLIGGGIGTIAGMHAFRHKTKKSNFTIGLPIILISEIVLVMYYVLK